MLVHSSVQMLVHLSSHMLWRRECVCKAEYSFARLFLSFLDSVGTQGKLRSSCSHSKHESDGLAGPS